MHIPSVISSELTITLKQVEEVTALLAEGATIPFIARYRKERTGGLDEDKLREIEDRLAYLTMLEERKQTVLASIEEQGKLTDELKARIIACTKLQEVEDLYLPYKPKRKTRGTIAKAKGLEPLALFILENPAFAGDFNEIAAGYINETLGVGSAAEAIQGAKDILAEMMSDSADVRKALREHILEQSVVGSAKVEDEDARKTTNEKIAEKEKKEVYRIYYDFSVPITKIKPYQILALNRGEKEHFLTVSIKYEDADAHAIIRRSFYKDKETVFETLLSEAIADSHRRLIAPSIERETRATLTETADQHAIEIFASNLRQLLLQPPLGGNIIMGIDPGYVSGSKVAVIDSTGKYLAGATIYPHPPQNKKSEAAKTVLALAATHKVSVIAIGNGTASRETEQFIAGLIKDNNLRCKYIIVNEAGASVYSASAVAKKEFPELEASQRGNISIARRLLDPLAELVKIDPKSIGVGLYQHDVDQKNLGKKLDDVVISCVNYVGVDVNTASASLLAYVSGLNKRLAESIVKHREAKGRFSSRRDLLAVTGMGEKTFEQSAGFLKIYGGEDPFDATFIHPESYEATKKLLAMFNMNTGQLKETAGMLDFFLQKKGAKKISAEVGVGEATLADIVENLKKPGRDPREELPKPILRSDVLSMEDLQPGMRLKGTIRNIVDFGAFVDIGVKQDALLHISQIADRYIKHPLDVIKVGDIVDVQILEFDTTRKRISVTMKTGAPPKQA